MRKLFLILMTLVACTWSLAAQTRTYHGTVLDELNEPLIGATIMPIGGGQGAAADFDGKFTITVPASVKKAKISYVGYTTQTVDLVDGMTVKMQPSDATLDDVVVVAYGTANKESLTGSVAVVGAQEIEDRPVTSVTAALEGNAPGVQVNNSVGQPGSSPSIRIRGFNSINGSNDPLYVVDGIPYTGSIADLNPADIESMSVLKDAASSALYGNRGANGVILITTKKAKKAGKVDVTLQVRQGMYNRGLPFYDRLDPNEWMQATFDAQVNGAYSTGTYNTYQDAIDFYREKYVSQFANNNIYGVPDNELFDRNGKFIQRDYLPGYKDDLDWWKAVSQNGYRQEYNVNAAAATEKFNIFASVGYLKENGYMLKTDFERFNARLNANFEPTSYLRFGVNLAATAQESMAGTGTEGSSAVSNPFLTMFTAPIYPYYAHNTRTGEVLYDTAGQPIWNVATYLGGDNVAWNMRLDESNYSATVVDGTLYGTAIIPYGFELTVRGSIHRDKTTSNLYMNNQVGSAKGLGLLQESVGKYNSHQFMQTLTWDHQYGDHHVDALLDHENYQYSTNGMGVVVRGQLFPDMLSLGNFNSVDQPSESKGMLRTESYLGRVRYNYDQKYFGEFSLRRDGTSRFAKKTRWGNFWSVGASWVISKEKFMANLPWVNFLKLRAAYGSVGNDASAGAYSYYSLYGFLVYNGYQGLIPSQIASDNIKWEATKTFDIGLDGSLFNDRFNFTVGYFNKRNTDLLFNVTKAASAGTVGNSGYNPTVLTNIGTMQNIGWELQFGVDIIRNREFKWDFSVDATFMKNKIIHLPNGRDMVGNSRFQGKSIYEMFTYKWAGVDQLTGRSLYEMDLSSPDYLEYDDNNQPYQDVNAFEQNIADARAAGALVEYNGKLYTTETQYAGRQLCGSALPTVYGSFGTNLSWKGINVGLLFTYSIGGKIFDSNYSSLMYIANSAGAVHKDALKAWTAAPEGMTADSPNRIDSKGIPQLNYETVRHNYASSSQFLIDASYLVFKNLNVSYDFPTKWVNALKLQNLNLGVSIDNIFTACRRKGMNPQYGWSGGQGASFVPARVFSFQLSVRL